VNKTLKSITLSTTIALFAIMATTSVSAQSSVDHLKRFLSDVKAYSADFDQVVLDENLRQIDEAAGTLTISRPGRFRWDYYPPAEQQIVGDGEKVWIYDIELRQVIVRDQKISLGQTPAILLAGKKDKLSQFTLNDRGLQGKVQWVEITPRSDSSGFDDIQVGFIDSALSVMVLVDGLGQTTRINFNNGVENPSLPAEQFNFVPADGVDIIDETQ
jgi:outer membrane lipoprotein carrier protein